MYTDTNTYAVSMYDSHVDYNSASKGGGAYFEFLLDPTVPEYLWYFYGTLISYNSAETLGGGIYY